MTDFPHAELYLLHSSVLLMVIILDTFIIYIYFYLFISKNPFWKGHIGMHFTKSSIAHIIRKKTNLENYEQNIVCTNIRIYELRESGTGVYT